MNLLPIVFYQTHDAWNNLVRWHGGVPGPWNVDFRYCTLHLHPECDALRLTNLGVKDGPG